MFLVRAQLQLCQNWRNGNATLAVGPIFVALTPVALPFLPMILAYVTGKTAFKNVSSSSCKLLLFLVLVGSHGRGLGFASPHANPHGQGPFQDNFR
jgi:hypothetical protein